MVGDKDWESKGDMSPAYVSPITKPGAGKGFAVLGQFDNMYIVAAGPDGLLVIDQHNAHELVLFEKYREIDRLKLWPRKVLLIPPLIELPPSAAVSLE